MRQIESVKVSLGMALDAVEESLSYALTQVKMSHKALDEGKPVDVGWVENSILNANRTMATVNYQRGQLEVLKAYDRAEVKT